MKNIFFIAVSFFYFSSNITAENIITKPGKYLTNTLERVVPFRLIKEVGKKMTLVVPGIRPDEILFSKTDDQKRTLTPKEAIKLGADYLVIGRPIIESKDPLKTIKKINQSIQ